MLFIFIFLFITIENKCGVESTTGTTLFYQKNLKNECWSEDDIAKLRVRKIFDQLLLQQITPDIVNTKFVNDALRFYSRILRNVDKDIDTHSGAILKEALADTIGGHLRSECLPAVRFAYYAGYIPYKEARDLHDFYDDLKLELNTLGRGWKLPERIPRWSNLSVVRIMIGSGRLLDPCKDLVTKRDSNSCIHLLSPRLDDEIDPSSVALPFKKRGLVSLLSPNSENVLLRYYVTAARCILHHSPATCRHSDFVNFNNDLWHWMKRDVAPRLMNENLYAAYGGVLRIAAAVQKYGKGLSRRNLFDCYESPELTKWRPWKALTESYVYIQADWTPGLCVGLVIVVAVVMYLLQVCYNYIFGEASDCICAEDPISPIPVEIAYANVDSSFPALLPTFQRDNQYYERNDRINHVKLSRSGMISRTQKVLDLNENTEKMMSILISGEESGSDSISDPQESEVDCYDTDVSTTRAKSPPKIETSIAQVKLDKSSCLERHSRLAMCPSSTMKTSRGRKLREEWTGGSTTSVHSPSSGSDSGSFKSRSRPKRRSRDLNWARRVVSKSKQSQFMKSSSATEIDLQSFTTSTSQR